MMRVIKFCQLLITVLIFSAAVVAQECNTTFDMGHKECGRSVCFKSKPFPQCRTTIITESGMAISLGKSGITYLNKEKSLLDYFIEIGFIRNIDRDQGAGCTAYFGLDRDRLTFGIKPRYRLWLGRRASLDISPGVVFVLNDLNGEYNGQGFMGTVMIGTPQGPSLVLRLMSVKALLAERQKKYDTSVSCGFTLGSTPGLVGIICYTSLLTLAAVAYSSYGC